MTQGIPYSSLLWDLSSENSFCEWIFCWKLMDFVLTNDDCWSDLCVLLTASNRTAEACWLLYRWICIKNDELCVENDESAFKWWILHLKWWILYRKWWILFWNDEFCRRWWLSFRRSKGWNKNRPFKNRPFGFWFAVVEGENIRRFDEKGKDDRERPKHMNENRWMKNRWMKMVATLLRRNEHCSTHHQCCFILHCFLNVFSSSFFFFGTHPQTSFFLYN